MEAAAEAAARAVAAEAADHPAVLWEGTGVSATMSAAAMVVGASVAASSSSAWAREVGASGAASTAAVCGEAGAAPGAVLEQEGTAES